MWEQSYTVTVPNMSPAQIWRIWSDISLRSRWDDDTEWATIEGPFVVGNVFHMKIKNGPKLKMTISESVPDQRFTDTYRFPLARLDGIHQMEQTAEGLCIKTTIRMTGILSWLWRKLVAEKIVATLPHQTDMLIKLARELA